MFNIINLIQDIKSVFEYPHLGIIVSMMFLFLCFDPKNLYAMWSLQQKLDRGELLPDRLASFPIHPTSTEEYLNSKQKIDLFVSQTLRENSCELNVSADDINNIYLHGESIHKYRMNSLASFPNIFKCKADYYYYQIVNNRLLQRRIQYLVYNGVDGISTTTRETRFINHNKLVMENHKVIEWNGRKMDSDAEWSDDKFYPLRLNDLFLSRLFAGDFMLSFCDEDESQRKLMSSVIKKITSVEIADGYLIIKVEQ